jgi:hypothetical protein
MSGRQLRWLVGVTLLLVAAPVWSQEDQPVKVTITGRMQVQWNTTNVDTAEAGTTTPIASNTFEGRRFRIAADVTIRNWIRGFLEPDFSLARLTLRQAWVGLQLDSGTMIRAGQFKKPFALILLTSSTRVPMVERGLRIRGLGEALQKAGVAQVLRGVQVVGEQHALVDVQGYAAYELGAEFSHRHGPFGIAAGVFNGSGPDLRDENDGKSFAARATFTTDVGKPLTFGAAWSRRELNWPTATSPTTHKGDAFGLDAELGGFRQGGLWAIADASLGDNLVTLERFAGVTGVLAYFAKLDGEKLEGIEPVVRASWGDPDDAVSNDAGLLLTPGVNLYFFGANRLMVGWDVFMPQDDRIDTIHSAKVQLNLVY